MALNSTILRFNIQLSDVDRGRYERLELRVAKHPSESVPFLLTRIIAYALNINEGIEFTDGISSPDKPAIWIKDLTGVILMWIDIGNPSARRIHKASKAAKSVRIYSYRDPNILLEEIKNEDIYRRETIELVTLPTELLKELGESLDKDGAWELLHDDGELSVTINGRTFSGEMTSQMLG